MKRTRVKIEQERSFMQQADYQCNRPTPWIQESPFHEWKSPTPFFQVFAHESSKVGGRGKKRKWEKEDRGQEADGKKSSLSKQKYEELKQGIYQDSSG